MRSNVADHPVFCVWCGDQVPADRAKKRATTCSKEHANMRRNYLRNRVEMKKCRYCQQPASPEQIASWKRWIKWEAVHGKFVDEPKPEVVQ